MNMLAFLLGSVKPLLFFNVLLTFFKKRIQEEKNCVYIYDINTVVPIAEHLEIGS